MVSEARIRANQANAARSTGPRTPEGKERSRANAYKHGLCAEVVGFEAPGRASADSSSLPPGFRFGDWLINQVETLGQRIEHAQSMQEAARGRAILRAEVSWDDDRRLEATLLADKLAARPGQVREKLLQTPQGCEWLMSRWALLANAADQNRGWTPEQASLAFDLLGTPLEFREGRRPEVGLDGTAVGPADLARLQVADLARRRDQARELDAAERQRAEAGLLDDAEMKRLRCYETALERRFRWLFELLREASAPPAPGEPEPDPVPDPVADPVEPWPTREAPPPSRPAPGPAREPSRAERRLKKAESRREGKRRKLQELRS